MCIRDRYTSTPCSQRCSTIDDPIPEAPPETKAFLFLRSKRKNLKFQILWNVTLKILKNTNL